MALRALMLKKKIDDKKAALDELRKKDFDFERREAELETSIEEAQTEEEQAVVDEELDKFEEEKDQHEKEKAELESDIADLEKELEEAEKNQPTPVPQNRGVNRDREGSSTVMPNTRTKFFGMTIQERSAFFAQQDVKDFIGNVRTCIKERRAIDNVGLVIPQSMLELIKQRTEETSKLLKKVNARPVAGTARQQIMGSIPEAIWTEACAKLNELSLSFNDVEVDGYKVGGFFAVCNAILEDNDVNLASEIVNAIGKAIGKAIDKAIVYGTGVKMPLGVVTRLAQSAKPSNYSATAREWKDLSGTNLITGTGATGINLFKEIVKNAGVIEDDYSETGLVWIMNKKTHTEILAQSMEKNLNAAIVAGVNNTMPVVGGDIIELPFIPTGDIVFGYFDMYMLAERAGTRLGQSEHYRFVEEQTIFKGTARYDGLPVIPEAFAVMNISSKAPTTSVEFQKDVANTTAAE